MARFYATFDNSTNATLEGTGSTYSFDRLTFTNGSTLKTALLNARSDLSAQFYAQIADANKNGSLGVTVPSDGFTVSGGNLASSELYTNPEAVYNSDTRDRPAPPITVANSTAITPADPWTIAESYYTACNTALANAMAGIGGYQSQPAGGVYGRLGSTSSPVASATNTLNSLWHDTNLTYFAWDDYTPGRPTSIAVNVSTTLVIITGINNYEFSMDRHAKIFVSYAGYINGQGAGNINNFVEFAPGSTQATFNHGITCQNGDPWNQMNVIVYYQLANQGVYPVALGSGAITVNGRDQTLTNQSGTVGSL